MKLAANLAKKSFSSIRITAAASAIVAGTQKKIHGFGDNNFNNFKQRYE